MFEYFDYSIGFESPSPTKSNWIIEHAEVNNFYSIAIFFSHSLNLF